MAAGLLVATQAWGSFTSKSKEFAQQTKDINAGVDALFSGNAKEAVQSFGAALDDITSKFGPLSDAGVTTDQAIKEITGQIGLEAQQRAGPLHGVLVVGC